MTGKPEFIDNLDGNTLAQALQHVLTNGVPHPEGGLDEAPVPPSHLDIATAFFSVSGFDQIAPSIADVDVIRLLLGAEPYGDIRPPKKRLDETPEQFERRVLQERLEQLEQGLRQDRDQIPFTRAGRQSLKRLIELNRSGKMETRLYDRAFMHAKAYIFSPSRELYGQGIGVIAGSSNLTRSGLLKNIELNLGSFDGTPPQKSQEWFQRLWSEAQPFEFVEILEEVFLPWSPYEIFLVVLSQLYGREVADEAEVDEGLPLTNFQKHGVARALRLISETGGAIVADEVGLGKTFIAGEILKLYMDRRQRCLMICPAQLRDSTWKKFLSNFMLKNVECVSYEELSIDRQIGVVDPDRRREILERPIDEYQLIVVDEAHNYRNRDTQTRAQVLRTLLYGMPRDLLLLTATPVNNSLWDLYNLILYYMRQDSFLANRGILSIKDRFTLAAREDPAALSPDLLYPIIDATTVKRTRQFVKRHYAGDTIKLPDGRQATIVFPTPRAITVTYPLPESMLDLFDKLETVLDPDGAEGALSFDRYHPQIYLLAGENDEERQEEDARAVAAIGLLRSGLLKRFESSVEAFRRTISKLIAEHGRFLEALDQGWVVTTAFLKEFSGTDDDVLEDVLADSEEAVPASAYDFDSLRESVSRDLGILEDLLASLLEISAERDPKLGAFFNALEQIATEAKADSTDDEDARQKSKVLVFSFFAHTIEYLRRELEKAVRERPGLAGYRDRLVAVAGSADVDEAEIGRQTAVAGFAPVSMEAVDGQDRFDVLLSTDVLAEGVNLQQCRHIINYDVPWNPMRLVQRHGRIDRIGSPHSRVFLRTVFPAERLDQLLNLETRILEKIALAAASVGVVSPVQGGATGRQVFSETREEIERLLEEDSGLFERGGASGAGQSGEEYRQALRKALEAEPKRLKRVPRGVGSGFARGRTQGVFFCGEVGERTYLRFIKTESDWSPLREGEMVRELGTCLRLIECGESTERLVTPELEEAVFDLWQYARDDIYESWMVETDPANLQPKVRPLNQRVAEFIRKNIPAEEDGHLTAEALDILEAPWPYREEQLLRQWFNEEAEGNVQKARSLIGRIIGSGLQPYSQPELLPPIQREDIGMVCWMGIVANEHESPEVVVLSSEG